MSSAREVALEVANTITRDSAYANLVTPATVTRHRLGKREAAQVTDLTYGTQRWRGLLDAVIDSLLSSDPGALEPEIRDLLRLGAYEIAVRREPAHIINEWVTIANRRFRRAAGLVNALLRKVSAHTAEEWGRSLSAGMSGIEALALTYSHPEWIVKEFGTLVGEQELPALLESDNIPTLPTYVALPGLSETPSAAARTHHSPWGFALPGVSPSAVNGIGTGVVRVQDEGSQLAALALTECLPIQEGERWLDLCAGPGGKTALLAAIGLPQGATLEANEVQPHRAKLVRNALQPFGESVPVHEEDGRTLCADHRDSFDRILVDAPCSGLGALRRRPESRWRKSASDLDELVPLQTELLDSAISALRVGGVVAYVTCSPHHAETVDVVDAVCANRPDVQVMDTMETLRRVAPHLEGAARGSAVQLWPHRHRTDAMFVQLLRRTR